MMRGLALPGGLVLAGAVGVGAWALSVAPPASMAGLRSLVEAAPASRPGAPGYPIRLKLPRTSRLGAGAAASTEVEGATPPAGAAAQHAISTGDDADGPSEARAAAPPHSGLLDMHFDIATFGKVAPPGGGRTIRTSKALNHGGNRVGSVDLALGHGSVVSVDRQALQTLVAGEDERIAAALAGMEGEMVSFDALRDRGIRIRYDPLADAVVIDGGG